MAVKRLECTFVTDLKNLIGSPGELESYLEKICLRTKIGVELEKGVHNNISKLRDCQIELLLYKLKKFLIIMCLVNIRVFAPQNSLQS